MDPRRSSSFWYCPVNAGQTLPAEADGKNLGVTPTYSDKKRNRPLPEAGCHPNQKAGAGSLRASSFPIIEERATLCDSLPMPIRCQKIITIFVYIRLYFNISFFAVEKRESAIH